MEIFDFLLECFILAIVHRDEANVYNKACIKIYSDNICQWQSKPEWTLLLIRMRKYPLDSSRLLYCWNVRLYVAMVYVPWRLSYNPKMANCPLEKWCQHYLEIGINLWVNFLSERRQCNLCRLPGQQNDSIQIKNDCMAIYCIKSAGQTIHLASYRRMRMSLWQSVKVNI